MPNSRIDYLLNQFYLKQITNREHEELLLLLAEDEQLANDFLANNWVNLNNQNDYFTEIKSDEILNEILNHNKIKSNIGGLRTFKFSKVLIAASVLIISTLAILLYFNQQRVINPSVTTKIKSIQKIDVAPGTQTAVLTLSNNKKIQLNSSNNGILAIEKGSSIEKTTDGQIIYKPKIGESLSNKNLEMVYNTISVPVGGYYNIELPDGTKVWLNSSSSLKYPTVFNGDTRNVKLVGEAYFEVAKNKSKPFHVNTTATNIEVLGTHFNISAYEDDNINKTTLLEGSVKITSGNKIFEMKPGDQATVIMGKARIYTEKVDTEEAVAWKNGYFMFNDENIHSIMKKLSRWYGVEVQFETADINETFAGTISKYKNISEVLKLIGETQTIHFKIMPATTVGGGRRVIVMK